MAFNHLDYSFTTDHEDGTYIIEPGQPGGGGKSIRDQLRILAQFMQSLNYINMKPLSPDMFRMAGDGNTNIYGLAEENRVFALHLSGKDTLNTGSLIEINLPPGSYKITWIDTKTAAETNSDLNDHSGGWKEIMSPDFQEDIAIRITKSNIVTTDLNISIHDAALNGQMSRLAEGLEAGIDVNSRDQEGRTALMYAAYNGHTQAIKILIEKGGLVNLADNYGRTALMMASSGPFPATVKMLLDNQADPNMTDSEEHFTALMYAAAEGQLDVVRILLSYRADPALKDIDGDDALTFAVNNGHKEVASLLQSLKK